MSAIFGNKDTIFLCGDLNFRRHLGRNRTVDGLDAAMSALSLPHFQEWRQRERREQSKGAVRGEENQERGNERRPERKPERKKMGTRGNVC